MTVIAAVQCSDGSVALAADDVGWWGDDPVPAPHKLFHPLRVSGRGRDERVVVAAAGSARVGALLRRRLVVQPPPVAAGDELDDWADDVAVAVEELALTVPPVPGDDQARACHLLLAAAGRTWVLLEPGAAWGDRAWKPYDGIGAGSDFALGFLAARYLDSDGLPSLATGLQWVREAVEVSADLTRVARVAIAARTLVAAPT